jgi:tRNA (mo5U34)-methyltransferase
LPGWEHHDWSPKQRRALEARPAEEKPSTDHSIFSGAFDLAIQANGVQDIVKPTACTIYEISPERLGMFDLVFSGSMLMHVRDPLLGMHAIRSVTKPGGRFVVSVSVVREIEEHALPLAAFVGEWDQSNFWQINAACLKRMLSTADFLPDEGYVLYDQCAEFANFVDRICVRSGTAPE